MKVNLSIIAISLSCIAIIISLIQPTYNFLISINQQGEPSFNISFFEVLGAFTRFAIRNNGTSKAENVQVHVIFSAPTLPNLETSEFISEIQKGDSITIRIPIGQHQLKSTIPDLNGWFTNASEYIAYIHITCDELVGSRSFQFENFVS